MAGQSPKTMSINDNDNDDHHDDNDDDDVVDNVDNHRRNRIHTSTFGGPCLSRFNVS